MTTINLMYHDVFIQDTGESGLDADGAFMYKMNATLFEEQVSEISKALNAQTDNNVEVVFTFDDGGSSFYTIIAPILEKYGFKGIFFIATKYIDSAKFLTNEQIKELAAKGHIVASHSHSHPENIALLDYSAIINEWKISCDILSKIIGSRVRIASIPNGDSSKFVEQAAANAGIEILYTSEPTTMDRTTNGFTQKGRYVVYGDTSTLELLDIIFNASKRRKMKIRYKILCAAHKLLGTHYNTIKTRVLALIGRK